jgi:hypothetical protein
MTDGVWKKLNGHFVQGEIFMSLYGEAGARAHFNPLLRLLKLADISCGSLRFR